MQFSRERGLSISCKVNKDANSHLAAIAAHDAPRFRSSIFLRSRRMVHSIQVFSKRLRSLPAISYTQWPLGLKFIALSNTRRMSAANSSACLHHAMCSRALGCRACCARGVTHADAKARCVNGMPDILDSDVPVQVSFTLECKTFVEVGVKVISVCECVCV